MHYKAIVVSVDIGGWIRLKLDGHISHGGVEFEARTGTAVLAQYLCSQVISVVESQQVVLSHVETVNR